MLDAMCLYKVSSGFLIQLDFMISEAVHHNYKCMLQIVLQATTEFVNHASNTKLIIFSSDVSVTP